MPQIQNKKDWHQAREYCSGLEPGYDLVSINDKGEQKFIEGRIDGDDETDYWIGLQEQGKKDEYMWVDGSHMVLGNKLGKYPWVDGKPNDVSIACFFGTS